jgi:hypothetical protein
MVAGWRPSGRAPIRSSLASLVVLTIGVPSTRTSRPRLGSLYIWASFSSGTVQHDAQPCGVTEPAVLFGFGDAFLKVVDDVLEPDRERVPQVVRGPLRAEQVVAALQDSTRGLVGECPRIALHVSQTGPSGPTTPCSSWYKRSHTKAWVLPEATAARPACGTPRSAGHPR